jgi:hypothetical protein
MQLILAVLLIRLLLQFLETNKAVANKKENNASNDVKHPAAHQLR